MKNLAFIIALTTILGCSNEEYSYLSVRNKTTSPIYVLPYTSDFSDGDWIEPGITDEFYSIGIEHLNGYEYFITYFDSVIIYVKDYEDYPVKFFSDGTSLNYDPELNPFINPEVWNTRDFNELMPGTAFQTIKEKEVNEDYFIIDSASIISLTTTTLLCN